MFRELQAINSRPKPFQFYTADKLWADEHTSKQMLKYHLNESIDISSRNKRFIDKSVEWICDHFGVDGETQIADFGCGPGLYTTRFAQRGAVVTGIDFSKTSLEYAKKVALREGLNINYVHANYLEFKTNQLFDLITIIMCDFCALSPEQRKQLLVKFYSLLNPGGAVLLDVYSLNGLNQKEESTSYEFNHLNGFWSPQDYYCFVNTVKYEKEKVTLDKYTIIEESNTFTVYNWLQHFSRESLKKEIEDNSFYVESFYSNVAGESFDPDSAEFAVVARKS